MIQIFDERFFVVVKWLALLKMRFHGLMASALQCRQSSIVRNGVSMVLNNGGKSGCAIEN